MQSLQTGHVMRSVGDIWEQKALDFLLSQGLRLHTRNFIAKTGELDLVMTERDTTVFIEVRQRRQSRYSSAAGSIDRRKLEKLRRTAMIFLQQHPACARGPCRFDVIAFDTAPHRTNSPLWLRGAGNVL